MRQRSRARLQDDPSPVVLAGRSDMTLVGTDGDDQLAGRDGDDQLSGLAGDDLLEGEAGNDRLIGGEGADQLFGGDGNDVLLGGEGVDRLVGGYGIDTASFETSTEAVAATISRNGNATVSIGGVAADTIESCEEIVGGAGDDQLIFTKPNSYGGKVAYGGAGDDRLLANYVDGGNGSDTLDLSGVGDINPNGYMYVSINSGAGRWGDSPSDSNSFQNVEALIGRDLSDYIFASGELS